jgi:hypothetical protein
MTTNANLYVDQGIDFAIVLDLFDAEGQDFDITQQEFKCEVRKVFSSTLAFEAIVQVNTDDNDANNLDLLIPGSLTEDKDPGKYQYDIIMYDGSSRTKILQGILFLLPTITRSSG